MIFFLNFSTVINRPISLILLSETVLVPRQNLVIVQYLASSLNSVDVVVLGPGPALPPAAIKTFLDGIILITLQPSLNTTKHTVSLLGITLLGGRELRSELILTR